MKKLLFALFLVSSFTCSITAYSQIFRAPRLPLTTIEFQPYSDPVLCCDVPRDLNIARDLYVRRNLSVDGALVVSDLSVLGIELRELPINGSDYIRLKAPNALPGTFTLTFPDTAGSANQFMITDGTGVLSWSSGSSLGFIQQGGNSFGTDVIIGSNDNYGLHLETNGTDRVQISNTGTVTVTDLASTGVVHTNASGDLSSSLIVNADVDVAAAIVDTKLDTISTAGKVSNSATTATSVNTASAIVARDLSGDFNASNITLEDQGQVRLREGSGGGADHVALQAPAALAAAYTLTLPVDDGNANEMLITDGSGVLSWSSGAALGYIAQGGNSFGEDVTIGSNDTYGLNLETNGVNRISIAHTGELTIPGLASAGVVHTSGTGEVSTSSIVNADVDAAAAIVDTKLDTISTAGKVLNSATTATNLNTASAIVARDVSGDFNTSNITLEDQGQVRLREGSGGGTDHVALQAPAALAAAYTLTLPVDDGNANEMLITDGSGVLSWSSGAALGYIAQGGNSFATDVTIGSNDNFGLTLETNGTDRVQISNAGLCTFNNGVYYVQGVPCVPANVLQVTTGTISGPNQFNSIKAAVDSIVGASAVNPYVVEVGPGLFVEDTITMKEYVSVVGDQSTSTLVMVDDPSKNVVIGAPNSSLIDLVIFGATDSGKAGLVFSGGGNMWVIDCVFSSNDILVNQTSTVGPVSNIVFLDVSVDSAAVFTNGFQLDASGLIPGLQVFARFFYAPSIVNPFTYLFYVTGPSAIVIGDDQFVGNPAGLVSPGTVFAATNGALLIVASCMFNYVNRAIWIPNIGIGPELSINSSFTRSCTEDLRVDNPLTTGAVQSSFEKSKTTIDPAATISLFLTDPISQGTVTIGPQYVGQDFPTITNISPQDEQGAHMGDVTGGVITDGGGLNADVSAGTGYLMIGAYPTDNLKYVEWTAQSIAVTDDSDTFLYIDSAGVLRATLAPPDPITTIYLGKVGAHGGVLLYIQDVAREVPHLATQIDTTWRTVAQNIYVSGSIVTKNGDLNLDVSSGRYFYSIHDYTPSGGSPINWYAYYRDGIGGYVVSSSNTIDYENYDNNTGALTSIPAGQYAKHLLHIVGDGANETYLLVYGQEVFATLAAAQNGDLPIQPAIWSDNITRIASIIVQNTGVPGTGLVEIRDERPRLGFSASSVAGVSDHGSLLGLLDDDHPQYLNLTGVRAMTGALNMGGNSITSVNLVDGVDVSAHASRHLPAGADPIPTGTPSTISDSTNSTGIDNTALARVDHVHAHGNRAGGSLHSVATVAAAGFMSAADKTKLDGIVSGDIIYQGGNTFGAAVTIGANDNFGLNLETNGSDRLQISNTGTVTITGLASTGVVHTNGSGDLSTSLIVNADVDPAAAIVDTKLDTISTAGKVSNSATTATNLNTASAIVARDASGNFNASNVTLENQGQLRLREATGGGTDQVNIQAPAALGASYTLTLPTDDGDANDVLITDGSGVLSWSAAGDLGYILQGGNSFGAAVTIGANDNFGLNLETNGSDRLQISNTGTVTVTGLASTGVVHTNGSGDLSTSLIVNADVDPAAAIVDTKLDTISTAGKVSNSATTATNLNTASAIVARDASGNFNASNVMLENQGQLRLREATGGGTDQVNIQAPAALAASYTLTLPVDDGDANDVLITDGSGVLSWSAAGDLGYILQGGNSFGAAVTIGANDNFGLNLETNGSDRLQISNTGTVTVTGLASTGVVHTNGSGDLSTSLIVNADVDPAAAIVDTKLDTISTAGKVSNSATTATNLNTASAIVARDASGNFNASNVLLENQGQLRLREATGGGTDQVNIQAPAALAASYTLTLPVDDGDANDVLITDGSGVLSWSAAGDLGYILQGGNSFGAAVTIGANDNFGLNLETNGSDRIQISNAGLVGINQAPGTSQLEVTGSIDINTGNLILDSSTSTAGSITKGASRFIHDYGTNNTFVGVSAGNFTMTGTNNTGIGVNTLDAVTGGNYNTGLGVDALGAVTSGSRNIGIGNLSLSTNATGWDNIAIGYQALLQNTATGNIAIGTDALRRATSATGNIAIGYHALDSTTTGADNVALGYDALQSNTEGVANIAIGFDALYTSTTGDSNVAVGYGAMNANTDGYQNIGIGQNALRSNTSGYNNVGVGMDSIQSNSTGNGNSALGNEALLGVTGNSNIGIGYQAGTSLTSGSGNICIDNAGVAAEAKTTRIGSAQTRCFVAGIDGVNLGAITGKLVGVEADQLGTQATTFEVDAALDVNGSVTVATNVLLENQGQLQLREAAGGGTDQVNIQAPAALGASYTLTLPVDDGDANDVLITDGSGVLSWSAAGDLGYIVQDGNSFGSAITIGSNDNYALNLETNGSDRVQISNAGLVGINQAPGTSQFEVTGSVGVNTGNLILDSSTSTTGNIIKGSDRFIHNYGTDNTFLGVNAGNFTTTGSDNVGCGVSALTANSSGISNTALGTGALTANTTGNANSAVGYNALGSNTLGSNNVAVGDEALYSNAVGSNSTAVGYYALRHNTSGVQNTALGYESLTSNSGGDNNTACGDSALNLNTMGSRNTAVGRAALLYNTTDDDNTALGYDTLSSLAVGDQNIAVGSSAGSSLTSGSNNIYVGHVGSSSQSGVIRIGTSGSQTTCFVAGIDGVNLGAVTGKLVGVEADQLGTQATTFEVDAALDVNGSVTVATNVLLENQGQLQLREATGGGTDQINIQAPAALGASYTLTLPTDDGDANDVLITDGSGVLSWSAAGDLGYILQDGNSFGSAITIGSNDNFALNLETNGSDRVQISNAGTVTVTGLASTGVVHTNGSGDLSTSLIVNADVDPAAAIVDTKLDTISTAGKVSNSATTATNLNTASAIVARDASGDFNASNITLENQGQLQLREATGGGTNQVNIQAPAALAGDYTLTLPVDDGDPNEVLTTDGSGVLSWTAGGAGDISQGGNSFTADITIGSNDNYALKFETNGNDRIQISNAGLVGVNQAPGSSQFEVTGAVDINSGNFLLDNSTSSSTGNILKGGNRFLHNYGTNNTFMGTNAGNFTTTGTDNFGLGTNALTANTSGTYCVAIGSNALAANLSGNGNIAIGGTGPLASITTGSSNIAIGNLALPNTNGNQNVAVGEGTLMRLTGDDCIAIGYGAGQFLNASYNICIGQYSGKGVDGASTGAENSMIGASSGISLTSGQRNILMGNGAGYALTSGSNNVMIGYLSGFSNATGSNNVYIGYNEVGTTESNVMRIGFGAALTKSYIDGIRGTTTGAADAIAVLIDSNGQLGTTSSSIRFKENVEDMADASDKLMDLRPVTFNYKPEVRESGPREYGLIAEEVEPVYPDLVVYDDEGLPHTVQYHKLTPMLLNELQKNRQRICCLEILVEELMEHNATLTARLDAMQNQEF